MKRKDIQHLYWRAGFGIDPKLLDTLTSKTKSQIVANLFSVSSNYNLLKVDTSEIDHLSPAVFKKSPETRKEFIDISNKKVKVLNAIWIDRLIETNEALRERMTLFWANHFACRDGNIYHIQQFNNTLREYALGDFGDFVKAISKEPAMLKYLDNKQNIKQRPNENFARELMELFMLGEGYYTEQDIKESARAFTGYKHNFRGDFQLRQHQHDYEFKSFFGKRGRYNGDDIIDIILEQKQCAKFICEKVYRYFVNSKINDSHIAEMVRVFYANYNISELMRFVFSTSWFYNTENLGTKIKSPIEFYVGIQRVVPFNFIKKRDILVYQRILGQVLLNPPNVAGWRGGRSWIDSSSIVFRLRLPSLILNNAKISTKEAGDFNDSFKNLYKKAGGKNQPLRANVNWDAFKENYDYLNFDQIQEHLCTTEINSETKRYLDTLSKYSKREFCVQIMSLPEYQMC